MSEATDAHRLDPAVDRKRDHVLGPERAAMTLVEFGSYACPYCRIANQEVAKLRDRYGDRMRYVFRQRPITGSDLARRAADLAESTPDDDTFWRVHVELMTRSQALTEADLAAVAAKFALPDDARSHGRALSRLDADTATTPHRGGPGPPTFSRHGRP